VSDSNLIVSLGESLIDFLSIGEQDGAELFRKQAGGAPMNVACGIARLGGEAAFVGKVGDDDFGRFLKATMEREGVNTSGLRLSDEAGTGLAFVSLDEQGDRSFTFYRDPAADMLLRPDELPRELLSSCVAFHHGSISLITEPAREATLQARRLAKEGGAFISYDPNLRELLWPSLDDARARILEAMDGADLVKVSSEELAFLAGDDEEDAIRALFARGPDTVVLTRGADGCTVRTKAGDRADVPGSKVDVIDTTGCGDAFVAAFLHALFDDDLHDLELAARRGCASGGLCATGRGAIDALPTRPALDAAMGRTP
jgi:fructokinase